MITEAPMKEGAKMRYRKWVRLAVLSLLLGSATAVGAQTRPVAPI
jgi:hypothetical protein